MRSEVLKVVGCQTKQHGIGDGVHGCLMLAAAGQRSFADRRRWGEKRDYLAVAAISRLFLDGDLPRQEQVTGVGDIADGKKRLCGCSAADAEKRLDDGALLRRQEGKYPGQVLWSTPR